MTRSAPTSLRFLLFGLLIFIAGMANQLQAQTSISGSVKDTIDYKSVTYATVMAIKASDSTLLDFARVGESGTFKLTKLTPGKIRLLIVRPGFADYEDFLQLDSNQQVNVGVVNMISKVHLLNEVIVRDKIEAIRIKGDTTEFLVDSFLTNRNSNVEDLMKRLPGIQVDKDGKITAQGKEVKKVLVDGEEFFGDDPTIATKNIKATQVESVQVFDKKSDQATATGVDDGEKERTINLKLKEDAKKGYFGKLSGGYGTDSRYENEGMINRFNKKQKISAYAAMSNTNKTGLNWEDNQRFGGSDNMDFFVDDDGSTSTTYYFDDNGSSGIPQTWYAGAHYSDKIKNDKHAYGLNLSYKSITSKGKVSNYTRYILPDTSYFNTDLSNTTDARYGTRFNGKYDWNIDSLTTVKFTFKTAQNRFNQNNVFHSENRSETYNLVNSNDRTTNQDGDDALYKSGLTYIKKFATKGRSLIVNLSQEYTTLNSTTQLNSDVRFYTNDSTYSSTLFDQRKLNDSKSSKYGISINYTEPFGKKYFLVTDYAYNASNDNSSRYTLTKSPMGDYVNILDSLSSDFRYDITGHRGGASLKYQHKKIVFSVGGRVSFTDLKQENFMLKTTQNRTFTNYFPAARFTYKIGTSSDLELSYNGRTKQPTLQQIQPLIDNTDPLSIMLGNNALGQSFTNAYSLRFNKYKPLTGSGIWTSLNFTQVNNDFTNRSDVTPEGKRTYQTVNVNGNYYANANLYHYYSIKKLKLGLNSNVNVSHGVSNNFVNGLSNVNTNYNIEFGVNFSREKEDKYYISFRPEYNYVRSVSSLREDVVTDYWIQTYNVYAMLYLPKKYFVEMDMSSNIRQKTNDFTSNVNATILNIDLTKKIGENDEWEFTLGVHDLLNQNLGFNRSATTNFVSENVRTVLKRFYLLKITYNFNSANKKEKSK